MNPLSGLLARKTASVRICGVFWFWAKQVPVPILLISVKAGAEVAAEDDLSRVPLSPRRYAVLLSAQTTAFSSLSGTAVAVALQFENVDGLASEIQVTPPSAVCQIEPSLATA